MIKVCAFLFFLPFSVMLSGQEVLELNQAIDIALESKIPIVEDPALARALYEQVEVEQEIPEGLYKAIAEIFTFVYNLNNK